MRASEGGSTIPDPQEPQSLSPTPHRALPREQARFVGHPVTGVSSHHDITRQITAGVETGVLRRGDRLPSERVLAEQFTVSRGTVRKAIRTLADAGLVSIRAGLGPNSGLVITSDVVPADLVGQGTALGPDEIVHVLVARRLFEPQVAQLAGFAATAEDLHELQRIIDAQRAVMDDYLEVRALDASFHMAIARATRNPTLIALMHTLHQHHQLVRHPRPIRDEGRVTVEIHEKTLQAIASGDSSLIQSVMFEHLATLEGAWEDETGRRLLRDIPGFLSS